MPGSRDSVGVPVDADIDTRTPEWLSLMLANQKHY